MWWIRCEKQMVWNVWIAVLTAPWPFVLSYQYPHRASLHHCTTQWVESQGQDCATLPLTGSDWAFQLNLTPKDSQVNSKRAASGARDSAHHPRLNKQPPSSTVSIRGPDSVAYICLQAKMTIVTWGNHWVFGWCMNWSFCPVKVYFEF